MNTLSALLNELHSLPLGNIYKKTINGKTYYYHQYFSNGKRYSEIIKSKEELELLKKQIQRRREIEKQIKSYKSRDYSLSKNADELTGYIMNKNVITARFEKGVLIDVNESLAPLVIKRTHSIEKFLKLRVIDMSRTNARILKKVLNIEVDEDYKTSLYAYALSVNDHYWFKPKHSKLKYNDVIFTNDILFDTSLKGEVNVFYHKSKLSPEITTTGSFEKGWRYIDNEWWLYKVGNDKQLFSELFSTEFANLIGVNTVRYELDEGFIRCKNFAKDYNFEPIASLADDNDNYEYIFDILYKIREDIAKEYLKMVFFDSVVNNIDRHNENLGLLRNPDNGKIISLAPNYDNNLSLIAVNESLNSNPKKDGFIRVFVNFLHNNEVARELYKTIKFKNIDLEDINSIIKNIPIDIPNKDEIADAILVRYNYLKSLF